MFRLFCVGIFAGCVITLAGCGGGPVAVEGRAPAKGAVFLDGEPLTGGGTIKFQSDENPRMRVLVSLDGSGEFRVRDAPTGKVKMTVTTTPELYPEMKRIPRKYSKLSTSGLEGTISDADEPFVIELKSKR